MYLLVSNVFDKTEAAKLINAELINSPWIGIKEAPVVKFIKSKKEGEVFEVAFFTSDENLIINLEKSLKNRDLIKIIRFEEI